jgi:hypothetical protein
MMKAEQGWEYVAGLIPIRFDTVPWGTGHRGTDIAVAVGRSILVNPNASTDELKRVYEALLEIHSLAPKIRGAIMQELGRSLRTENIRIEEGRTIALRHMIGEVEARMRSSGERPRGGIRAAAIAEVAEQAGLTVEALIQRIKRLKRRRRRRFN